LIERPNSAKASQAVSRRTRAHRIPLKGACTPIEWLWVIDLIELSWDILRYRVLPKALGPSRQTAIQSMLERIDLAGIDHEYLPLARHYVMQNVADWRTDPAAAVEIESPLEKCIVAGSFNLEAVIQRREQPAI
jgi:hypothetical protein